jgi:hypothetical protein
MLEPNNETSAEIPEAKSVATAGRKTTRTS